MAGSKKEIFQKFRPILEIKRKPVLVGDIGAGKTTKLVNQVILAVNIAIVVEALILGKKTG